MSDSPKTRLPIWLIASLMANALLVGLLIGGGLGQKRAGPPIGGGGSEQALMRGIDQAVPSDQRRAVRQAFRRAFADTRLTDFDVIWAAAGTPHHVFRASPADLLRISGAQESDFTS